MESDSSPPPPPRRPVFVALSGGSGSGKTTVLNKIMAQMEGRSVGFIFHDSYYRDHPELNIEDRRKLNYDHPDSLENDLLISHLEALCRGETVEMPLYDFAAHGRKAETLRLEPKDVLLLDGILLLTDERVRNFIDIKVYVDTDADVRFLRRLLRDVDERGRTVNQVVEQYLTTVKPMHERFVEPCKRYADIILPGGGGNTIAIDLLVTKIAALLAQRCSLNPTLTFADKALAATSDDAGDATPTTTGGGDATLAAAAVVPTYDETTSPPPSCSVFRCYTMR